MVHLLKAPSTTMLKLQNASSQKLYITFKYLKKGTEKFAKVKFVSIVCKCALRLSMF